MKILFIISLLSIFFGCASAKTQEAPSSSQTTQPQSSAPAVYMHPELKCQLTLPAGWIMDQNRPGRLVVFADAGGQAQGELFHQKLQLPATSTEFGMEMHRRLSGSKKPLGKLHTYGKLHPYLASFIMTREGQKLRYRLYTLTSGLDAYVISCVCPEASYPLFQNTFEEIFASFKIE